jgi:hypothetical protein
MRLSVDFDGLAWGDLYQLVDAARAAGVPGTQTVEQVTAMQDEDMVVGLAVELPSLDGRALTLTPEERMHYGDMLSAVIDSEGDTRRVLSDLRSLRDRLLNG